MPDLRGRRTGEPLEERIARLEDIESIKQLYNQYATYCDNGYDAEGMGTLMTEDAVWTRGSQRISSAVPSILSVRKSAVPEMVLPGM